MENPTVIEPKSTLFVDYGKYQLGNPGEDNSGVSAIVYGTERKPCAEVMVYDGARLTVYGAVNVIAHDASVFTFGPSRVIAQGSSTVTAYNGGEIIASQGSSVDLFGTEPFTIIARDMAQVNAREVEASKVDGIAIGSAAVSFATNGYRMNVLSPSVTANYDREEEVPAPAGAPRAEAEEHTRHAQPSFTRPTVKRPTARQVQDFLQRDTAPVAPDAEETPEETTEEVTAQSAENTEGVTESDEDTAEQETDTAETEGATGGSLLSAGSTSTELPPLPTTPAPEPATTAAPVIIDTDRHEPHYEATNEAVAGVATEPVVENNAEDAGTVSQGESATVNDNQNATTQEDRKMSKYYEDYDGLGNHILTPLTISEYATFGDDEDGSLPPSTPAGVSQVEASPLQF